MLSESISARINYYLYKSKGKVNRDKGYWLRNNQTEAKNYKIN